jgi:hypothetical protein
VPETLRRAALSALIAAHLIAVVAWLLPPCALRERVAPAVAPYLLATGQWQHWGMFAPEPARDTLALEVMARDAFGRIHSHAFPRMADRPVLQAALGYRHSKLTYNMGAPEAVAYREYIARHAARSWNLPPEAFPLDLDLFHKVWPSAPLGQPEADPLAEPNLVMLQAYRFPTPGDVQP